MRSRAERDVELAAVRIRTAVGHGQDTPLVVAEDKVLIGEGRPVDTFAAGTIAAVKVAALRHKPLDNPMEGRVEVSTLLIGFGSLELGEEISCRAWHNICRDEQPERAQLLGAVRERQIRPLGHVASRLRK